ncbi:putative E3 ubiquitin-protein ligase RZFP34 [Acropora cervicornis]|uniref:E3 ubiquitin-protein ligase RZFP34 n=1 Tax=Acropora cervicornis TaxID=6130 RepID=A0AAD9PYW2_ACRCE|nr:putative E3 ubiquitin-protein ligase RZFP34 [Acropora cervicornis]
MAGVSPVVDDMQGTSIESCNGKIGSSCSGPRASSASAESDSGISSSGNSAFLSLLTGRDGLIVGDGNQLTLQHNSMERDKRTVGRGECDPDCSSKAGDQPPPEHNPSEPDQLTEGSREPDAANSSYRNWERQGARPKHTQMQGPVGLPVWPSSRLVSDSVAEDLLPHHSQDKVVRESPERFRDTSFVHGSDSPYFGTVLPPDYFVTNDHSLTGEEDSSREWDSLLDQNFCGSLLSQQQINTPISPNSWFVNGSTCSDYDAGIHPRYSLYRAQRNDVEANDYSPVASEQGTAEPEQLMSELQEKKQLIRDKGERTRREQEDSKWQGAEPSQQEDVSTGSRRLCEHYERRCRVRFSCCTKFYPCHNCHNNSTNCQNGEAKARDATHLKCSLCQFEQEIDQSSDVCHSCGEKMAAYFCFICKHFKSSDKNPYHCDQCGICRHYKDKKFHCKVCNVCLDKRLNNNHKCRPDSGHDECCICFEDTFPGCLILPCSHKIPGSMKDSREAGYVKVTVNSVPYKSNGCLRVGIHLPFGG